MIFHLSFLVFLVGLGSCSTYDVQRSPDEIFHFYVAKFRTRAGPNKINVTELVGLLKNGSEVAGKVQGVFEKVQKLKDGPINVNDLMEVGKEVYDVGKQAYDVGKQAFEIGKNVFEVGKNFLDKHQELLQVGKTMGKTLASISKHIGPALGGIGIAFAFITMFMPKEDSAELVAIKNGFKEMHQRFDQVSNQIKALESKIDFYQAIKPYQDVRDSLEVVYRTYTNFAEVPTSAGYRKAFSDACANQKIEPLQALEKLRRVIVNPGPEDQPHMIKTIIVQHKLDYKTIMGWFERITQNAYTLAMMRSACFGTLHGSEDSGKEHSLNQTETWVKEIIAELAKFEESFTNLHEEFVHVLKSELEALPNSGDVNAERELNERCDKWEMKLVGNNMRCLGDPQVNGKRVAVNSFLNTKYYWLNWLVVVYQGTEADDNKPCDSKPGSHWILVKGTPNVFVSWSRRDAVEAAQLREQANQVMDNRFKEFKPDQADTWDTFYGTYGKYFIVFNVKMHGWIQEWLQGVQYKNRTVCSFGGYVGTYVRAVATSGVAAYRSQSAYRYSVDYLVIFW